MSDGAFVWERPYPKEAPAEEPGAPRRQEVGPSAASQTPAECEGVPLLEQVAALIQLLAREIKRDEDERFRTAPFTAAQAGVADALASRGALPIGELAGVVSCVPANITALVDRLERKGLAQRSSGSPDRRVITVSLTEAGARALDEARSHVIARSRLAGALDEEQLCTLVEMLGPLYLRMTGREAPG